MVSIDVLSSILNGNISSRITIAEVQALADDSCNNLLLVWSEVKSILERHEPTIHSRWRAVSYSERREVLRSACPHIPEMARPDSSSTPEQQQHGVIYPYINLEDLSEGDALLLFTNARGRSHPTSFVPGEYEFSPRPPGPSIIDKKDPKMKVSILQDIPVTRSGRAIEFGEAFRCPTKISAQELETRGMCCGPTEALYIFSLQAYILEFLHSCCKIILGHIPTSKLLSPAYPVVPEPAIDMVDDDIAFNLTTGIKLVPYRLRLMPNYVRLQNIVSNLLRAVRDYVWALREDPAYFAECFYTYKERYFESMLNDKEDAHSSLGVKNGCSQTLSNILQDSHCKLTIMYAIDGKVARLRNLAEQQDCWTAPEVKTMYMNLVEEVYYLIWEQREYEATRLTEEVLFAPELKHLYQTTTVPYEAGQICGSCVLRLVGIFPSKQDYRVAEPGVGDPCLEICSELLEQDIFENGNLSHHVKLRVERLHALNACLQELRIPVRHGFWAARFDYLNFKCPDAVNSDGFGSSVCRSGGRMRETLQRFVPVDLGDPADEKFDYPDEDALSESTVEARRKAEHNLDRFWKCVDKNLQGRLDHVIHETVQRIFGKRGNLQRTPRWCQDSLQPAITKSPENSEYIPLPTSSHNASKEMTGSFDHVPLESKPKTKTRAISATNNIPRDPKLRQDLDPWPKTSLYVDRESYIVLNALFHSAGGGRLCRKIRWSQVLSTFTKLGFSAEKKSRSAWLFTPTAIKLACAIMLHEPRPNDEISLHLARRYGRRLTRAYNWDRSTFVKK